MGFLEKLKELAKKIFKVKSDAEILDEILGTGTADALINQPQEIKQPEPYVPLDLPEGKLVSFSDEVLDTEAKASVEKFKHNLKILMKQTKENGKVDKFMLIREDDFFPHDWEWRVLSKDTNLELVSTSLSYEVRKKYALEQSGIDEYEEIMGVRVPTSVSFEELSKALSKVDKNLGSVLLPSRFRSTKHFTVNTPLGVTGYYNNVYTDRDYIIIDNMDEFLKSGYGYSIAYHDAYLDISHESLPISEEAIVLINDEKYEKIMSDEKVASELAQRRVVRFKGDESIAINMILTEIGALPSTVGFWYAQYDSELRDIVNSSIKDLAQEHGLFFDRSHAGKLKPDGGGHFSNYYDEKNTDYAKAEEEFGAFLKRKFPEHQELFLEDFDFNRNNPQDFVIKLGTKNLLEAIDEYNDAQIEKAKESLEIYKQDRKSITPEIHDKFVSTVSLVNDFYKTEARYSDYEERMQTEECIRKFFQSGTVAEQLETAQKLEEILPNRINSKDKISQGVNNLTIRKIVSNALASGISIEQVLNADSIEQMQVQNQHRNEEAKDDK